jgi:hypothetical protein
MLCLVWLHKTDGYLKKKQKEGDWSEGDLNLIMDTFSILAN